MKKYFFLFALLLNYSFSFSQSVIINEVMFAPENGEPEWVELYNTGATGADLSGMQVWDSKTGKNLPANTIIMPNQYCIVTKDTQLLKSIRADMSAAYIQIALPTFNNDFDAVVLKSTNGYVEDSVYYEAAMGKTGKSLERKYKNSIANFKDNWFASKDSSGATCGYKNSNSIKSYDLELLNPNFANDSLTFKIYNSGELTAQKVKLCIYVDKDKNGLFSDDEAIKTVDYADLDSASSFVYAVKLSQIYPEIESKGTLSFKAEIKCESDENWGNNKFIFNSFVPFDKQTIIINEIMFDTDGECGDFIELANLTNEFIDIAGWKIGDSKSSFEKFSVLIDVKELIIKPGSYALIVFDTNFYKKFVDYRDSSDIYVKISGLSLNAGSDAVVLFMRDGSVCDSVVYDAKWTDETLISTKNVSLERIGSAYDALTKQAWASSADSRGASPLKRNSCYYQDSAQGSLTVEPNPVSLNKAPGRCFVKYSIKMKRARLNSKIYNLQGERVKTLMDNELIGSSGYLYWDGKNDDNFPVESGAYILLFEANDTETGEALEKKKLIVVAPE